jgi:hypothetical protein
VAGGADGAGASGTGEVCATAAPPASASSEAAVSVARVFIGLSFKEIDVSRTCPFATLAAVEAA